MAMESENFCWFFSAIRLDSSRDCMYTDKEEEEEDEDEEEEEEEEEDVANMGNEGMIDSDILAVSSMSMGTG
jgi:hypothetical protein